MKKNHENNPKHETFSSESDSFVHTMHSKLDTLLEECNQISTSADELITKREQNYDGVDECGEGVFDSGVTSVAGAEHDKKYLDNTGKMSDKSCMIPDTQVLPATKKMRMDHNMRPGAIEMHIVPGIHTSLVSACMMADNDYIIVLDKKGVNIYDGWTERIIISEAVVLSGYKSKDGLWRVQLRKNIKVENKNTDKIVLDHPNPKEAISHVFELPSIKNTIACYHAAAGFPTKETWIRAISAGNYNTWPGLNVKTASKHFPESKETQMIPDTRLWHVTKKMYMGHDMRPGAIEMHIVPGIPHPLSAHVKLQTMTT